MSIQVEHLTKIYGDQRAVDDISFTVQKGEIVGFLGPNGAGKSTTMKIATCYIPPTSGTVKLCGFDVTDAPLEVKRRVGYLPEQNPLYYDMYIREYLEFAGSVYGLKGAALQNRINEMIELVGLTPEKSKKIGQLSKGYKQRVGLAQAIIHNPEVLILDEPTTGLDPNQLLEIREVIRTLGKDKTVLFSTHIMQEVQALCNRVIIIQGGKIVADDKVDALKHHTGVRNILIVEFAHSVDEIKLKINDNVIQVSLVSDNKYQIEIEGETDLRSHYFKLASDNGWTLLEIRKQDKTIENVFIDLTNTKNKK